MSRTTSDRWAAAVAHLVAADPRWAPVIARHGPCGLTPRRDRFGTLVRAIIGQQISSQAAAAIDRRLRALTGDPHTPAGLLAAGRETIQSAGVSGVKAGYLLHLAEAVASRRVPLDRLGRWDDEAIIARLVEVKGVGRWTAEMFLIFALNRPDVLPVLDLGVRVGLQKYFGLAAPPRPSECAALAAPWRPYRTVAMWYLWRDLDAPRAAR